jgi:hypothetical protein
MIVGRLFLEYLEQKIAPLWWHDKDLQKTVSGYGRKIETRLMVRLPWSKRWRRVYCCQYSNAGTCYVQQPKGWIVIA